MWKALNARPSTGAGSTRRSSWHASQLSEYSHGQVKRDSLAEKHLIAERRNTGAWQQADGVSTAAGSYCRFCHKNGESAELYLSHVTKERSGAVQCPVLRSYQCPVCGLSGDRAHTLRYCPRNRLASSYQLSPLLWLDTSSTLQIKSDEFMENEEVNNILMTIYTYKCFRK